uniref:RNase_Zc3h12a domain-containing protein n=1 Tax=Trichuris muris TaxID=70415 RepID=A0A5S6Q8J7_TRIMR
MTEPVDAITGQLASLCFEPESSFARDLSVNTPGAQEESKNSLEALSRAGLREIRQRKFTEEFRWNKPIPVTCEDLIRMFCEDVEDKHSWDNGFKRKPAGSLRPIVIDGSNVAFSYGNPRVYSPLGIAKALRYFLARKHSVIAFTSRSFVECTSPYFVEDRSAISCLAELGLVVLTPIGVSYKNDIWHFYSCYEDQFIIKEAYETGGIIVSNDMFKDVEASIPLFQSVIKNRTLNYVFTKDKEFKLLPSRRSKGNCPFEDVLKFYEKERVKEVVKESSDKELETLIRKLDSLIEDLEKHQPKPDHWS